MIVTDDDLVCHQSPPLSSNANESNPNLVPSRSKTFDPSLGRSEIDPHGNDMRFDELN